MDTHRPEGVLVAIGGGDDSESGRRVLRRVTELVPGGADRVAILPTAGPRDPSGDYAEAFRSLGVPMVDVLDVRSRADAHDGGHVRRLEDADVVFLTGGDRLRLTSVLGGSPVFDALRDHYLRGGVVAGAGAGAAAMSDTMILQVEAKSPGTRGRVQLTPGLGFLDNAIFDTRFGERGRFTRLLEAISANPGHVGLGIGEDAAVVLRGGSLVEVVGRGMVVVVDGQDLRHTNVSSARAGRPIVVENMIVHTLAEGYSYDLDRRRCLRPPEERPLEEVPA